MALKMRQSLAQLERDFLYESELDQRRREHLNRNVRVRSRRRHHEREKKRSSMRFYVLVLTLLATALIVTAAMFYTLYSLLS
jgi:hypothetical protein